MRHFCGSSVTAISIVFGRIVCLTSISLDLSSVDLCHEHRYLYSKISMLVIQIDRKHKVICMNFTARLGRFALLDE